MTSSDEFLNGTRSHALRHYYASVLLAAGVSVKELAEYLGHADPGFTLRTYIHMLPDSHERAMRAIDGRHFRPRPVSHATLTQQGPFGRLSATGKTPVDQAALGR